MRKAITAHGPLPQHVQVVQRGDNPEYQVNIPGSSSSKSLAYHPLSPKGRAELGDLIEKLPTERGNPKDVVGVAHPPIIYKPSEWTWEHPVKGRYASCVTLTDTLSNVYPHSRHKDPPNPTASF